MENPVRIAVLISGRGSNMEALIKAVDKKQLPVQIAVVVSDQQNAQGLAIASRAGIPTLVVPRQPKILTNKDFNLTLVDALRPFNPQLIVLAGFMRIIHACFIEAFQGNVINIHPSLLPSFRGVDGQGQALLSGVRFAGCSVHYVVPDVDAGPIIAQAVVPVMPHDTHDALAARILAQEHRLLPAAVKAIALGQVKLLDGGTVEVAPDIIESQHNVALLSLKPLSVS
jgi:phosphoribosylglycinamide formyltransferase 1